MRHLIPFREDLLLCDPGCYRRDWNQHILGPAFFFDPVSILVSVEICTEFGLGRLHALAEIVFFYSVHKQEGRYNCLETMASLE